VARLHLPSSHKPGCPIFATASPSLSCIPLCRRPECRQAETTDPFSSLPKQQPRNSDAARRIYAIPTTSLQSSYSLVPDHRCAPPIREAHRENHPAQHAISPASRHRALPPHLRPHRPATPAGRPPPLRPRPRPASDSLPGHPCRSLGGPHLTRQTIDNCESSRTIGFHVPSQTRERPRDN